METGSFLLLLAVIAVYFIPSGIAFKREKRNSFAILAVNLFFGWTFIGWVVAFVWSIAYERQAI